MDDVYQKIWDADQSQNGLAAIRSGEPQDDSVGFVLVDESSSSVGNDHKVIKHVVIPDSKRTTYDLCQSLFDNYALLRAAGEFIKPEELQEELDFIDGILETLPIQKAKEIMEQRLGLTISNDVLAAMIKETWFKMATAGSQDQASGFEHVFVGEQARTTTKIGGYHYWHKYFLDDGGAIHGGQIDDRIEYHGTRYQHAETPAKGILVPEVVTLSLTWQAPLGDRADGDSNPETKTLTKSIGGFFVGCSPECLIAMGLVRCRTPSGKMAKINGSIYQLDLHRLDNEDNSIRTFFPRFVSSDVVSISGGGSSGGSGNASDVSFRMMAAMVNPPNPEGGREFIQLINTSASAASLAGWSIIVPNGTRFEFSDVGVGPGETFKFIFPTSESVLRNRSGQIQLVDPASHIAQTESYSTEQATREGSPIIFV